MKTLAVVGVGGLVGDKMLQLVRDRLANKVYLRLFGRSETGKRVLFGGKWITVEPFGELLRGKINYALFAVADNVVEDYLPKLAAKGTICIDNGATLRLRDDVPLVVPSVNGEKATSKIIANPNCVTIPLAMVLDALSELEPYKITVATYQAASGGGKEGLNDLLLRRRASKTKCFSSQIFDNVLPFCGKMTNDGYTTEEHKLMDELPKILGKPIDVNCCCVRVPVTVGHGCFVNVALKKQFTLADIEQLLRRYPDTIVCTNQSPTPLMIRNSGYVAVGRLVKDRTANAVNMFVSSDNLLRGAAYNALEILEIVMRNEENLCRN